jgi:hypothetical protein
MLVSAAYEPCPLHKLLEPGDVVREQVCWYMTLLMLVGAAVDANDMTHVVSYGPPYTLPP